MSWIRSGTSLSQFLRVFLPTLTVRKKSSLQQVCKGVKVNHYMSSLHNSCLKAFTLTTAVSLQMLNAYNYDVKRIRGGNMFYDMIRNLLNDIYKYEFLSTETSDSLK